MTCYNYKLNIYDFVENYKEYPIPLPMDKSNTISYGRYDPEAEYIYGRSPNSYEEAKRVAHDECLRLSNLFNQAAQVIMGE